MMGPRGVTPEPASQPVVARRIVRYRYFRAKGLAGSARFWSHRSPRPGERMVGDLRIKVDLLAGRPDDIPAMYGKFSDLLIGARAQRHLAAGPHDQ